MHRLRLLSLLFALALAPTGCGDERAGAPAADTGIDDTPHELDALDDPDPSDATPSGILDALDTADPSDHADSGPDLRPPEPCPWHDWSDGLAGGRVDYAAFDPRLPGVALAASGGALARSVDDGAAFTLWGEGVTVRRLAFPPDDPKVVLAATSTGLYRSEDSGRTFTQHALGGLLLHTILLHPALPQRVFAGTEGAGIMRSDDGGQSFRAVNVGVPRMLVYALAAPPDDPDLVLATGILQNDNYGPGGGGLVLRTTDSGLSWTTATTDAVWGYGLAFCPRDPERVVAAVRRGALISHDRGLTWERIAALEGFDVLDVQFPADTCERLYVSAYQRGIFRVDGGALSGPHMTGIDVEIGRFAPRLVPHPSDPDTLLLASHAGLFRSTDGAFTWTPIPAIAGLSMNGLAHHAGRSWLTTWGNGLWTRTAATPWQRVDTFPRDFAWLVAPLDDLLVAGGANDVFIGDARAETFTLVPGLYNATDAMILASTGELLVTSQVAGLMRSARPTDPTVAWTPSNTGLSPFPTAAGTYIDARAILADPTRPGRLYLGLLGAGVAISDDDGATWRRPDNALSGDQVAALFADLSKGVLRLYALVSGKGVWLSQDGGETWGASNQGLDTLTVFSLVHDEPSGRLFASELSGVIKVSDDGLRFESFDAWCLPVEGWGHLALTEDDGGARWLVASTRGNRVIRHRID